MERDGGGNLHSNIKSKLDRTEYLRESKARRVLVGAVNDSSALGALRAFQEAGRAADWRHCRQNAETEARAELRTPGTRLVASVAYFPEKYGDGLIRLALDILGNKAVPPAIFTSHQVITPENVDHFYPNDGCSPARPDWLSTWFSEVRSRIARPLAYARGSDQSRDREGAFFAEYERALMKRCT